MKLPVDYTKLDWRTRKAVREAYIEKQNKACYFCDYPLDGDPIVDVLRTPINLDLFPLNFLKHPIHLQHCHKTGMTEGAVHARCNAVMWQYHGR